MGTHGPDFDIFQLPEAISSFLPSACYWHFSSGPSLPLSDFSLSLTQKFNMFWWLEPPVAHVDLNSFIGPFTNKINKKLPSESRACATGGSSCPVARRRNCSPVVNLCDGNGKLFAVFLSLYWIKIPGNLWAPLCLVLPEWNWVLQGPFCSSPGSRLRVRNKLSLWSVRPEVPEMGPPKSETGISSAPPARLHCSSQLRCEVLFPRVKSGANNSCPVCPVGSLGASTGRGMCKITIIINDVIFQNCSSRESRPSPGVFTSCRGSGAVAATRFLKESHFLHLPMILMDRS